MSELKLGQDKAYLQNKAKRDNLVVFLPEAGELFLDLDNGAKINERVLEYISDTLQIPLLDRLHTTSRGGNVHIYLRYERTLTDLERVIFQVCLGSDQIKELFSFMQLKHVRGIMEYEICECPIALFETQSEALRVNAWRTK